MIDANDHVHCARCGAFVKTQPEGRRAVYECACGHRGRIWGGYPVRLKCEACCHNVKAGETWVPYGDTNVKASDDYECSKGYQWDDCPDDEWEGESGSAFVSWTGVTKIGIDRGQS